MSDPCRWRIGDKIVDSDSSFNDLIYNSDEVTPILLKDSVEDRLDVLEEAIFSMAAKISGIDEAVKDLDLNYASVLRKFIDIRKMVGEKMSDKDTKWFTVYGVALGSKVLNEEGVKCIEIQSAFDIKTVNIEYRSGDDLYLKYEHDVGAKLPDAFSKTLESIDACFQTRLWDEYFDI